MEERIAAHGRLVNWTGVVTVVSCLYSGIGRNRWRFVRACHFSDERRLIDAVLSPMELASRSSLRKGEYMEARTGKP